MSFQEELQQLINRHSKENDSHTPDFILAEYINMCLEVWDTTIEMRDKWWSFDPWTRNENGKVEKSEHISTGLSITSTSQGQETNGVESQ